jgi:hypothetical protein
VWEPNGDKLEFKDSSGGSFCEGCKSYKFAKGQGAPGRCWEKEDTLFTVDVQALDVEKYPRLELAKTEGIHSVVCKFKDGCVFEYGSTDTLEACPEF